MSLALLLASCAGQAPTSTPAATSTATITLTPTPEVIGEATLIHEAIVMEEPAPRATQSPTRVLVEGRCTKLGGVPG